MAEALLALGALLAIIIVVEWVRLQFQDDDEE